MFCDFLFLLHAFVSASFFLKKMYICTGCDLVLQRRGLRRNRKADLTAASPVSTPFHVQLNVLIWLFFFFLDNG